MNREFKCCAGCNCLAFSDCCAMEVTVEAPPGQPIGYVKQTLSCLAPKYDILNENMEPILSVEGPVCICQGACCTWDQEFIVSSFIVHLCGYLCIGLQVVTTSTTCEITIIVLMVKPASCYMFYAILLGFVKRYGSWKNKQTIFRIRERTLHTGR